MNVDNTSGLERGDKEFSCCCLVAENSFELDGGPTIQIIICILAIPTFLIATLANLLVIISIWRTPSLHSPSNILILVGLAFSDFAVGLVTQTTLVAALAAKITKQACLFCGFYAVSWISGHCLCVVSLFTLTAISLDRYIAIHFHLRYQEIATVKRVFTALIIIWLLSSTHSSLYGLSIPIAPYGTVFLIFSSLVVIMFASCSIYRVVRRHQREITAQMQVQIEHREGSSLNMLEFKRSFINMQILCCSLLLCYLPCLVVMGILLTVSPTQSFQSAFEFSVLLVHSNSALNPFLYCWRYQPIRAALVKLMRDAFCKTSPR